MKNMLRFPFLSMMLVITNLHAAGATVVLKTLPENYVLRHKEVVYVDNDGRCKDNEVLKITGGKTSEGIPRKYECVKRPE
ncbi:MAG: hypothetical protein PHG21_09965 [Azoarcus sp.]|nr:hypothetical protein [Azoarcus sp.]